MALSHLVFVSFLSEQPYKCWWFRCVCDSNCVGDIVILGVPWEPYVPEICPLFHITVFLTKYSHSCHILLAPSGALVFIMGYYISNSTAQLVFQIIQILKSLKDPTCAIFFKSMGFKDISNMTFPCIKCKIHKYANIQIQSV